MREEGPLPKPLIRRGAGCGGEAKSPESFGAVKVAPSAFGVDDASAVPRGPARTVPVSSGEGIRSWCSQRLN